ncbi:hypothetical protein [Stieleria maiorica]|uniref:hypothetical protein n=1 Tax=Stieleria maiorica TaxID=2795974 RepID=UPI0011C840A6|nr:hypothetical protein [Stieleria maiorica]
MFLRRVRANEERSESAPIISRAVSRGKGVAFETAGIAERGSADLYDTPEGKFLHVTAAEATLVHDEHAAIALPTGFYRVWRQREYSPEEIRIIRD